MIGILLFLIYLILGFAVMNHVFVKQAFHIRVWSGFIVGILGMMWTVVPFAFFFKFSKLSHGLGLCLMVSLYGLVTLFFRKRGSLRPEIIKIDYAMTAVILLVFAVIAYLLTNHILVTDVNGALGSGQSTYGDLPLHLGIASSIAEQGTFPPEYSIFPGKIISYPFLVDSLSSSLLVFGTSLRLSLLIPSYVMALLLVMGFYILSYDILKHRLATVLSTLFFFFNGGFGFVYFMDGLAEKSGNFTRMFSTFYNTPTNYTEHNIRWVNTICDMIIPQRTTMAGWMVIVFAIWTLYQGIKTRERTYFAVSGMIAGLMPMVHTHSFLAFGLVSATWLIVYLFQNHDKKKYILDWLIFLLPVVILAVPQVFYWTVRQATEGGFLKLQLGWEANMNDLMIWFWIKNVGLIFILLIPALFAARKKSLSIYSGAAVVYVVSELILFQPNNYDNNKLFYIWYMFTVILVAGYVVSVYNRLKGMHGREVLLGIVVFICIFSGVLTIGREAVSYYEQFSADAVKAADYVKNNTPKDALFLTDKNHNNAIAALTGRNIYSGTGAYLYFHGIDQEARDQEVKSMYTSPDTFAELAAKINIDYVYISNYERNSFHVDSTWFDNNYPALFKSGDVTIYKISDRARAYEGLEK